MGGVRWRRLPGEGGMRSLGDILVRAGSVHFGNISQFILLVEGGEIGGLRGPMRRPAAPTQRNEELVKRWLKSVTASGVAIGLVLGGAAAAHASDESEVKLVVLQDEAWIDVDMDAFEAAALHLHPPAAPDAGKTTSRLIDWNQWFGCFSLNNANDVFDRYWFPWDGRLNAVNLKCGDSTFGYKHIKEGHESQWQDVLNRARSLGWPAAQFGIESWDDMMSGVTSGVVADPGLGLTKKAVSNKWCTKADFGLWDITQKRIVYVFGVEAAWASDSDRLITSFPSTRKVC